MAPRALAQEIAARRSTTHWTSESIDDDVWETLLQAARHAPSSWNKQPARYVWVTDRTVLRALCDVLHRTNRWAKRAPGILVQFAVPHEDDIVDGKFYYLYDCGLAMMSLVYQAQVMGLSSRQMIGFDEDGVREVLGIPSTYRVVVLVGIGYPSKGRVSAGVAQGKRTLTGQRKRLALDEMAARDRWKGRT